MPERTVAVPSGDADPHAQEAILQVVRGNPTPEEIAALVAVLFYRQSGAGAAARPVQQRRSAWGHPAHVLGRFRPQVPRRVSRFLP